MWLLRQLTRPRLGQMPGVHEDVRARVSQGIKKEQQPQCSLRINAKVRQQQVLEVINASPHY